MKKDFLKEPITLDNPEKTVNIVLREIVDNIKVKKNIEETVKNIKSSLIDIQDRIIIPKYANKPNDDKQNENITLGIKKIIEFMMKVSEEKIDIFNTILSIRQITSSNINEETIIHIIKNLYYYNTDENEDIKDYISDTKESIKKIYRARLPFFLDAKVKINKEKRLEINNNGSRTSGISIKFNGLAMKIKDDKILLGEVPVKLKKYNLK